MHALAWPAAVAALALGLVVLGGFLLFGAVCEMVVWAVTRGWRS